MGCGTFLAGLLPPAESESPYLLSFFSLADEFLRALPDAIPPASHEHVHALLGSIVRGFAYADEHDIKAVQALSGGYRGMRSCHAADVWIMLQLRDCVCVVCAEIPEWPHVHVVGAFSPGIMEAAWRGLRGDEIKFDEVAPFFVAAFAEGMCGSLVEEVATSR